MDNGYKTPPFLLTLVHFRGRRILQADNFKIKHVQLKEKKGEKVFIRFPLLLLRGFLNQDCISTWKPIAKMLVHLKARNGDGISTIYIKVFGACKIQVNMFACKSQYFAHICAGMEELDAKLSANLSVKNRNNKKRK